MLVPMDSIVSRPLIQNWDIRQNRDPSEQFLVAKDAFNSVSRNFNSMRERIAEVIKVSTNMSKKLAEMTIKEEPEQEAPRFGRRNGSSFNGLPYGRRDKPPEDMVSNMSLATSSMSKRAERLPIDEDEIEEDMDE